MIINGKIMNFNVTMTIEELFQELDLNMDKVVVEVNFEIISRERYCSHILNKEDRIEIVSFVGGG